MTDLAQCVLNAVPPDERETEFRSCTVRLDTSTLIGIPSTFDTENGELHSYQGERLELTAEREAAIRAWAVGRSGWTEPKLRAAISERRWRAEVSGCEVLPGVRFPTTRDARAAFVLELERARQAGPGYSKKFEIGGHLIPVILDTLEQVVAAIQSHVDAAFKRSEELITRIDQGESLEVVARDLHIGWPG